MYSKKVYDFYFSFINRLQKNDRNACYYDTLEEKNGDVIKALRDVKESLGIAIFEDGNLGLDKFFYEIKTFMEENEIND